MLRCSRCHKPLNSENFHRTNDENGETILICRDGRLCEPRQIKYKQIPKVRELANRFTF